MWYSVTAMVFVVALGLVGAQKETVQLPHGILRTAVACTAESKIDPGIISQLTKPSLYDDNNTKDNRNVPKFLYCMFNKLGYGGRNGHIKVDRALNLFPNSMNKPSLKNLMESCNEQNGDDAAETTYKIFGCFIKKTPIAVTV